MRLYGCGPRAEASDIDWGLACNYVACTTVDRLLNVALDFSAFLMQDVYVSAFFCFIIYMIDLQRVLLDDTHDQGFVIMPALRISDARRGFERFEPLLTKMMWIVLIAFLLAYLVRLENLYLASDPEVYSSLWEFVREDVVGAAWHGMQAAEDVSGFFRAVPIGVGKLFELPGWTRQTVLSGLGVLFLYSMSGVVLLGTVRALAARARDNATAYYANPQSAPLYGMTLEEEAARANTMQVWPLNYIQLNTLIAWSALAIISLVFYRLGLLIGGFTIGQLVFGGLKAIHKTRGQSIG